MLYTALPECIRGSVFGIITQNTLNFEVACKEIDETILTNKVAPFTCAFRWVFVVGFERASKIVNGDV